MIDKHLLDRITTNPNQPQPNQTTTVKIEKLNIHTDTLYIMCDQPPKSGPKS